MIKNKNVSLSKGIDIIKNELDPILMEHRDRIMDEYFVVPMDL